MKAELAPSAKTFLSGLNAWKTDDPRDAMYRVATRLLAQDWGNSERMADDLGVLLLTWNQAFYRYGGFDYDRIQDAISHYSTTLNAFRERSLDTLKADDEPTIESVFDQFVKSTRIAYGKSKGKRSPVAAAKALHLLCPGFFPLWDQYIARAYGCNYSESPGKTYVGFCRQMKDLSDHVSSFSPPVDLSDGRTLVKRIDEYNYGRFTLGRR